MPRGGAFSDLLPHDLASPVIRDLLARADVGSERVGELILSNALGAGGNPARIAALAAGLPERVAGLSVDRQCAGGLDALIVGDAMIRAGVHEIVIAGGVESYSRAPLRMHRVKDGPPIPYYQAPFTPWPDRDPDMAADADALAQDWKISRDAQDRWAVESHRRARAANGLAAEITPINGVARDPFTRELTLGTAARARSVAGNVTAANMAVAADGAGFVLMVSEGIAKQLGKVGVALRGGITLGADPTRPSLAPVPAINSILKTTGLCVADLALIELMEAFAAQAIAGARACQLPCERINTSGGALARGHPIGASGAVLAVRLFHDLQQRGGTGLAAIASAGGLGSALLMDLG
ncbi:MAG: thiolase family protein [Pseudomonadota bacterium]